MPRDTIYSIFSHQQPTLDLIENVRREKYMQPDEKVWADCHRRVAAALFAGDPRRAAELEAELLAARACPAGRVLAGAGTHKNVTWWNCFVSPLLQDSMLTEPNKPGLGIWDTLRSVAVSMQMGGGVGTDFSPLRPEGALVRRVHAPASGPLSFMDTWDAMCRTVMSAGARRGAMMGTLICWHPDIRKFVRAKHNGSRLRMFNLSVLVTDDFMRAVEGGTIFQLGHWEPPFAREVESRPCYDPYEGRKREWFIYETVDARELWDEIMRSTYDHAEPGVIFVDRINYWNNLGYCEHIQCTNPCGEQPLPNDQNCNLSHTNLSRCIVGEPFTETCRIGLELIRNCARLLVRMSDSVIDLSPVPTEAQRAEAQLKRRVGLGVTGLANALMFVRQRYGSPEAIETVEAAMRCLRDAAYAESIELAKEKGPFPAFDRDKYLAQPFIKRLPEKLRDGIAEHGIRNALLLTIAPTGTVSIAQGENSSSGLEPVFLARYERKKLEPDGSFSKHVIDDLGFRAYANAFYDGNMDAALISKLPDYMVTTDDLSPEDHLLTQAAVQKYVDSAVSKTINVREDVSFEEFSAIYLRAYDLGCKGCTTYRPNEESGRGAVLSAVRESIAATELSARPTTLPGETYKFRWPTADAATYVTINDTEVDGRRIPYEVFVNSMDVEHAHWQAALTRMISAVMRKGGDLNFIPRELSKVQSTAGGAFVDQQYVPSDVAMLGIVLQQHFRAIGYSDDWLDVAQPTKPVGAYSTGSGERCPSCKAPGVMREEGCKKCPSCGWSNCA